MATIENVVDKSIEVSVNRALAAFDRKIDSIKSKILDSAYPVGSIYLSLNAVNPSSLFGGSWELVGGGMCLWGSNSAHIAGSIISAGLPNITGSFLSVDKNYYMAAGTEASGAFTDADVGKASYIGTSSWTGQRGNGFTLDASRSSSIYGKSSTVQPPAFVVNIWKRTK